MHGVVDGIQVQLLGLLSQIELALSSAVLGVHTHLQVLLGGVGQDLAQQLSELGSVLGLLQSGLLPVQADLGIALTVSHTAHGQVHTNLGALALEVLAQALDDLLGSTLSNADNVLGSPGTIAALQHELLLGSLADGAEVRGGIPFVNITANRADPLFHLFFLLIHHFIYLISGYPEVLISNDYHF